VPTHAPFTASPKRALKRWTGNRPYHNGALAIEWLPEHPQDWPALASVLGRTLIHLQTVSMPHFGLMVNDGQFHSSQSSWPAAWEAYVLALTERAVERGVDMGPHTRRLAHAIANQIQALEANTRWTLVHGNLGPQSLEVLTGPEKTAPCLVTGWEEACAGDRLIDVAALLGLSAEQLGPVLAVVDDELIASWLHPESLRRIEVYHWTWCLAQLCIIGDYYGFDRRLARLGNLGRMRTHAMNALEPEFCRRRLEDALTPARRATALWTADPIDPVEANLHVGLAMFGVEPSMKPEQALKAAACLGAGLLAGRMRSRNELVTKRCLLTCALNPVFGQGMLKQSVQSIDDVAQWREGVSAQIATSLGADTEDSSALVLWWTALEAVAVVDGDVSAAWMQGIQEVVEARLECKTVLKPFASGLVARRLTWAVLGLGAIHGVREHIGQPDAFSELREVYQKTITEVFPQLVKLSSIRPNKAWSLDDLEKRMLKSGEPKNEFIRPLVTLALWNMHGLEPVPGGIRWVYANIVCD